MMAASSSTDVSRDGHPEEVAQSAIRKACELILQLPFQWAALLDGINPKTFLANVTGISKSRVAEGSLDQLRPSSLRRAEEHSRRLARERALEAGFSEGEFDDLLASQPRLDIGLLSSWGGLFHFWSNSDGVDMTETIVCAVALEGFAVELHAATEGGDWMAARRVALKFLGSGAYQSFDLGVPRSSWETAEGWGQLHPLLDRVLMAAYETLFATLDAEWGAQYFGSLLPQPVLLWLAPEVDLCADGKLSRRNGIRRPVRKLLELSFVLAERAHSRTWPSKAPGRGELGKALELADAHVGNYFDGTRKMTLKAFGTWWQMMTNAMAQRFRKDLDMPAPMMLARVGLLWQGYWVKEDAGKLRAVILLDQADHRRRWQAIRRRLSAKYPEGQGDWPAWLTAQSSSSD